MSSRFFSGLIYIPRSEEQIKKQFKLKDEFFKIRGPYMTQPLEAGNSMDDRSNLIYPIPAPDGSEILPRRQWVWSKDRTYGALRDNRLEFKLNSDGNWSVRWKYYLLDEKGNIKGRKPFSIIEGIYTQEGTREITEIFEKGNIFPFPKPTALIKHLLSIANLNSGDIILDFFAGSCTTADAVLMQNQRDAANRQFIMVQLPEPTPPDSLAHKTGYKTIADIGKERTRRVIRKIQEEHEGKMESYPNGGLGFKVFRLDRSNFKDWKAYGGQETYQLEGLFDLFETPIVEDWNPDDLLTEIILLKGFPLDSRIVLLEDTQDNSIQHIRAKAVAHDLFVCLDEQINDDTIQHLHLRPEDIFVCLDSALSDEAKIRLADQCNLNVI